MRNFPGFISFGDDSSVDVALTSSEALVSSRSGSQRALTFDAFPSTEVFYQVVATVYHSSSAGFPAVYRVRVGGSPQDAGGELILSLSASSQGFYSGSAVVYSDDFVDAFTVKFTGEALSGSPKCRGYSVAFLEVMNSSAEPPLPTRIRPLRVFRFANIGPFPRMDPRDLKFDGSVVVHANAPMGVRGRPMDVFLNDFSGVIMHSSLRGRDLRVPAAIRGPGVGAVSPYGEPLYPWSSES